MARRVLRFAGELGHVDGYRLWLQSRNRSEQTQRNYLQWVRAYQKWCREHELNYLAADREHITYFLGHIAEDHAPTTTYLVRSSVRSFYDYLKTEGKVRANPTAEIKWRHPDAKPVESFSDTDLRRMYGACRTFRERAIFLLFVGAGLRRGEIFRIKKDDVNFEQGTVTVFGKGSHYRTVAPGPMAMEALFLALEFEEALCPYAYVEYVWSIIRDIAKRAGMRGRIFPHRFRHTFATKWLDEGGSIEELSTIFGHSDLRTTMVYVRSHRKQRAVQSMLRMDLAGRLRLTDGGEEVVS